jgi:CheY-like chemotaxis protein
MKKLLLIDSDTRCSSVLQLGLRLVGYPVTTTAGAEALDTIRAEEPNLLIVDTRPSPFDTFELVATLKGDREFAGLPMIVLGEASRVDERRAFALGVDEYLAGPVFVREVAAHIQLLLARRTRESLSVRGAEAQGGQRLVGSTDDVALVDLLRRLEACGESGVMHVRNCSGDLRVFFRDGSIVDAELGSFRGEESIFRALLWEQASFEVEFREVTTEDVIGSPLPVLLAEGMRRLNEWAHVGARIEPPIALLEGNPQQRPAIRPSLPESVQARLLAPPTSNDVDAAESAPAPEYGTPSAAPWTREVDGPPDPAIDTNGHVAGVPSRMTRSTKRAAAALVVVGGVLTVALSLNSVRARQLRESELAHSRVGVPEVMAPPEPRPGDWGAPPAPSMASVEPMESVEPAGAQKEAMPALPDTGASEVPPVARVASVQTSPPDIREVPLDVGFKGGSMSPLVRDAQGALLKGDMERALELAQSAVSTDPSDADGWLTLAAARKATGDSSGARQAYVDCIASARTVGLNDCRALALAPANQSAR